MQVAATQEKYLIQGDKQRELDKWHSEALVPKGGMQGMSSPRVTWLLAGHSMVTGIGTLACKR
jgi:hypothetical protein